MSKTFLARHNHLPLHVLISITACTIAFLLVGAPQILATSLYHDHATIYSFYRNSFLSVLHFGEIRWWDPTVQNGFPTYYFSFLGLYAGTPLFWLTEGCLYLLHLCGVRNLDIQALLLFYTAFMVPLLFNLSFLSLVRQIFTCNTTILLVTVMAAFSPCVIYSASEVTFEMTAYGFFVAAALLHFQRCTTQRNYLLLNLALSVFLVSFNHLTLYWNFLFLVLFAVALTVFPEKKLGNFIGEFRRLPVSRHVLFVVSLLICLAPALVCFGDGSDIYRSGIGKRTFDPLAIFGGNPLEILLAGVPGAAVGRTYQFLAGFPGLIPADSYVEYLYLGALALPLSLIGLTHGRSPWRKRIFLLAAFFAIAVMLGGNSAFLGILYLFDTPLRAVRHFGDTTFRNGLFAILIIAAGLGFDVLQAPSARRVRRTFFWVALLWLAVIAAVAATALFLDVYHQRPPVDLPTLGFMLTVCFFYLPLLLRFRSRGFFGRSERLLLIGLLVLDLTCTMYLFVRIQVLPQSVALQDGADPFQMADAGLADQENSILVLKDMLAMKESKVPFPDVPYLGLVRGSTITPVDRAAVSAMTYNSLEVRLTTPEAATLYWLDAWFKGWRAQVNGRDVPVSKYRGVFKAVPVPAGSSVVRFSFLPWPFVCSLLAGWSCVLGLLGLWCLGLVKGGEVAGDQADRTSPVSPGQECDC